MSKEILTRCGFRCDLCLAYKDNIERNDQREFLSDTWFKIYGFRIPAKEIYCEGCISANNPKLIDNKCPVRPCVIGWGLENCSQCDQYPCDTFDQRKVVYETVAKDIDISKMEYAHCIKPYENKRRLDDIRNRNFPFSRLLNPEIIPDDDSMERFMDDPEVKDTWSALLSFLDHSYQLDRKIRYCGRKYGWAVRYRKNKKTVATIFPERNSMTVLLVFGRSELEEIDHKKAIFSADLLERIKDTKSYHDGKWLWLRMYDNHYFNDISELIKMKRKPKKSR
ncbi:MAG TPA: DUF3788 family protein [Bacteroidales bacterium]